MSGGKTYQSHRRRNWCSDWEAWNSAVFAADPNSASWFVEVHSHRFWEMWIIPLLYQEQLIYSHALTCSNQQMTRQGAPILSKVGHIKVMRVTEHNIWSLVCLCVCMCVCVCVWVYTCTHIYVKPKKIIVLTLLICSSSYIQYINRPMHSTK